MVESCSVELFSRGPKNSGDRIKTAGSWSCFMLCWACHYLTGKKRSADEIVLVTHMITRGVMWCLVTSWRRVTRCSGSPRGRWSHSRLVIRHHVARKRLKTGLELTSFQLHSIVKVRPKVNGISNPLSKVTIAQGTNHTGNRTPRDLGIPTWPTTTW